MKKSLLFLITLFFSSLSLFANPVDYVKEYKLENGFTVFLLQDTTTPLIRVEYTVRAGFSSQTQKTSGFFKLYSRVFEASVPNLKFDSVQCNADSTRYIITVPGSKIENTISSIADVAFNPNFSNETIKTQYSKLKNEVKENFTSMSGFINAAIDSRIFSEAPWKHDSGVYPAVFNSSTEKNNRTILSLISDRWYTPQNSAIFVSGNFNIDNMEDLIETNFGRFYSTFKIPLEEKNEPVITKKKFVLHNPEFSDELTQVVIQYVGLNPQECDTAAILLNNNYSYFKYNLLNQTELNIPGDEYIDASAAHKRDSSRLIIQTLLQAPEDKKIKTNSLKQTEKFVAQVKYGISKTGTTEFLLAKQNVISNLQSFQTSSKAFMENLSAYWAISPYENLTTESIKNPEKSITAESLLSKIPKFEGLSLSELTLNIKNEEPFVFVIINSDDYKKNKKEYANAGFEEITIENASWKDQKIFEKLKDSEIKENPAKKIASTEIQNDYYSSNTSSIKEYDLKNGISVITKNNNNSKDVALLVSIRGGKLNTATDHGFEEVMINILTNNIQREIYNSQQKGQISGSPTINWQCDLTTSHIIIECSTEDLENICTCVTNAVIYSDILPSTADRSVANRQYKKRLENGSANNQLYSAAINYLYPKTDFVNLFETEKDILEGTDYQKILQYYPLLLDSSRYTVIITGNVPENILQIMNNSFGLLANLKGKINIETGTNKLSDQKTLTVLVNHTFLTDIPAEKAGPMPAILIPTEEFLDPVMYIFSSPKKGTKESAIYNALHLYISKQLQNEIDKNSRLKNAQVVINPSKPQMDTAGITIQNVPHTKEMDATYKLTIQNIKKNLQSNKALEIIQEIKDLWVETELEQSYTNAGTAELLHKGLEYLPYLIKPAYYLDEYNFIQNAKQQDFIQALNHFPEQAPLRIYSKEGKK